MKILIVEDDQTLARNVREVLVRDGFAVDLAETKEKGLIEVEVNEYDCIVLDINLPDGSGFEFLSGLRKQKDQTPIIIITARGEVEDRVRGLNLGADDYLPKPIHSTELIARIRALIRRNSQNALPEIVVDRLVVKPAQHLAEVDGKWLDLTAKEFAVLEYLAQHSGQVITRAMLMEHVWGSEFESFSNVIDVYIRNLRRKLEDSGLTQLIRTVRGKGYVLGGDDEK